MGGHDADYNEEAKGGGRASQLMNTTHHYHTQEGLLKPFLRKKLSIRIKKGAIE